MLNNDSEKLKKQVALFPQKPGVYLFFDQTGELVYVGKATNLRSRVGSYFKGQKSFRPIEEMIEEIKKIDFVVTDSVLEAIILEAEQIKKHNPKYNVFGKDDKSWNYIVITKDVYPRLEFAREHDLRLWEQGKTAEWKNIAEFFGPFPGLNTREVMKIFRKLFFVSECRPGQKRACLYHEMHQCLGVCTGEITPAAYRQKVIAPLRNFLKGRKKQVLATLEKNMKSSAQKNNFEEAARLRNQIFALRKIADVTLLNKSFFETGLKKKSDFKVARVEAYDISNLGETGKVGSMIVFDAAGPVKSEYRKFNIKTVQGQSDVDCLKEVLTRRIRRDDWVWPEVMLIDGGVPQVHAAQEILKSASKSVFLLGIAKGPKRDKNEFILVGKNPGFTAYVRENKNLLIRARDEAHRFAVSFHRSKRKVV